MNSEHRRRILILGGTGVFGKRLARHLAKFSDIELIITSRTLSKATAVANQIRSNNPDCSVAGARLEHNQNLEDELRTLKPFIVVDCSGPFQSTNYDTAKAVLASGAHMIDLADARNYLKGFSSHLDGVAKENNVVGLAGASSTPALSACAVRHVTDEWQRIDSLDFCITPGGKSEVGHSVIAAVLSYAGKKIPVWQEGSSGTSTGWSNSHLVDVPNLGPRRVAHVETFDAELLGPLHKVSSKVTFSAGLESWIEQRGIETIALLRKLNLSPDPHLLVPLLVRLRKLTRIFSSDKGGMLLQAKGIDQNGNFVQCRWSLLAKQDHGPNIPILPAAVLVRKILKGELDSGAVLAYEALTLSDIIKEAQPYDISFSQDLTTGTGSVYETNLGPSAYSQLPAQLRRFHSETGDPVWTGKADVDSGSGLITKVISKIFGFPATGRDIPVTVTVERNNSSTGVKSERWIRNFSGKRFSSVLTTHGNGSFTEQFGPFRFEIDLTGNIDGIKMPVKGWNFGPLPLPLFLAPRSETTEYEDQQGRFNFNVRITLPLLGLLAHYRGWLEPEI